MSEIKAILFDAGGVIQSGSGPHFLAEAEKTLGLTPVESNADLVTFDERMNKGEISVEEMLAEMYPGLAEGDMEKLLALWENEWPTDWDMIEVVKKLKENYVVGMISNSDIIHEERFEKESVLELFEKPILSHRVHLIKPGKEIFALACEQLELDAGQCVFIDDAMPNIEIAKELGFHTILFIYQAQFEKELRAMEVNF